MGTVSNIFPKSKKPHLTPPDIIAVFPATYIKKNLFNNFQTVKSFNSFSLLVSVILSARSWTKKRRERNRTGKI